MRRGPKKPKVLRNRLLTNAFLILTSQRNTERTVIQEI